MRIKLFQIFIGSFLLINNVTAQLCTGSLGDPLINVTFGSGNNPGAPISAAGTNYQYVSSDCPPDGNYTIRNNTNNCFSNSWHPLNADHTGDANGYFMLINASYQPGVFYLDTVKGLCGNTTYEFAAWIVNVLRTTACNNAGIQPNLTFSIERTDGTLLQSFNTNNIPQAASPEWKQYGFFFTTPPLVSDVVLRITNNAPGGCGNDIALDDITFKPCGPSISETIDLQPSTTRSFCEGPQRSFTLGGNISEGITNPAYQWQTRNSNNTWSDIPLANLNSFIKIFNQNTPVGVYEFRLAVAASGNINSAQCRVYSKSYTFTINQNPVIAISNNSPVCEKSSLSLTAAGGTQYQWDGPNNFMANTASIQLPNIQLSQSGKYYTTVTNTAGCTNKDSATVIVNPAPIITTAFADTSICAGDNLQLIAAGGSTYQWIPAKGLSTDNINDPTASPAETTQYLVIGSNQYSCKDTAGINVIVNPKPVADAGPDKIIFKGQSVQLSGSTNNSGAFEWSPAIDINDIHVLKPIVNPKEDRYYTLKLISSFGCGTSIDSSFVKVFTGIYIPNAFSPNGDNLNDTWDIPGLGACNEFEVSVYNRWGQLVFQTKNIVRSWDGKFKGMIAPAGIYTYYIKACDLTSTMKGILSLIR